MKQARSPINGMPTPRGKRFTAGESARENGRKGALKTNSIKAKRKTLREQLQILLSETDDKGYAMTRHLSISLIKAALQGNVRAFEVIRDTIGEKPVDEMNIVNNTPDPKVIKEIQEAMESAREKMENGNNG